LKGIDMSSPPGVVLYHHTSIDNARAILCDGFRDSAGFFLNTRTWTGVWFSSIPTSTEDGEVVLTVKLDIDEQELARWEWSGEGRDYREWLIPADIVNRRGKIQLTDHPNSIVAA
jgi:hypothetical protein